MRVRRVRMARSGEMFRRGDARAGRFPRAGGRARTIDRHRSPCAKRRRRGRRRVT
ncbi:hypothetical protein BMA721280_I0533 [Burkholderia mallei 2002721280]|nr:hypothetical protein BMA721280_I0533 [Burkholderia mallei 2002721280]